MITAFGKNRIRINQFKRRGLKIFLTRKAGEKKFQALDQFQK